jgi:hypothetical protein
MAEAHANLGNKAAFFRLKNQKVEMSLALQS